MTYNAISNIVCINSIYLRQVWIGIALAMLIVLTSLYILDHYFSFKENVPEGDINKTQKQHRTSDNVFSLLLRQGGKWFKKFGCAICLKNNLIFKLARLGLNRSKNIPYLLIGVVWCFSSLILVITYTSLLTSYITAPSTQYLIKSVQELVDRPDIWIVTDKNRNSESLMLVSLR